MRALFSMSMLLLIATPAAAATIPTVPIGNAGNTADPETGFGAVDHDYRIGKYEVTNAEYAEFLNAKAQSDPYELYNEAMGGITRSGSSPNYSYALVGGMENKPVAFVSWYDGVRFANWLHNGQGDGDTETGAYTVNGFLPTPGFPSPMPARNPDARWFLPTQDEWYKAAYYDPQTDSYFDYPTSNDTAPTAEAPAGGSNSANYDSVVGALTNVGSYADSASPYGTFDQGGNLAEWSDGQINQAINLGGSYIQMFLGEAEDLSAAGFRNLFVPDDLLGGGAQFNGFRVAAVPEPPTRALALIACAALAAIARRRRRSEF